MVLSPWRESSTIPAALYRYLYFRIKRRVRIISVQCNNVDRGELDPVKAFIAIGPEVTTLNESDKTVVVKSGYVCSFGDLIWQPKQEVILEPSQQIMFQIFGVLADDVHATVLYEDVVC